MDAFPGLLFIAFIVEIVTVFAYKENKWKGDILQNTDFVPLFFRAALFSKFFFLAFIIDSFVLSFFISAITTALFFFLKNPKSNYKELMFALHKLIGYFKDKFTQSQSKKDEDYNNYSKFTSDKKRKNYNDKK